MFSFPLGASSHCLVSGKAGGVNPSWLISIWSSRSDSWVSAGCPTFWANPFPRQLPIRRDHHFRCEAEPPAFRCSAAPKPGSSVLQKPLRCCVLFNASALALEIRRRTAHAGKSKCSTAQQRGRASGWRWEICVPWWDLPQLSSKVNHLTTLCLSLPTAKSL